MNIQELSLSVFKLNLQDTTSEDYVYFQILHHLGEYGSFKITDVDKKFKLQRKSSKKFVCIERRKLKKIITGEDKNFQGLIPLNYIIQIPHFANRGGNQEYEYYLTEKGIMASLGFYSIKKNINLKKIFKTFEHPKLKRYKTFIHKFILLQIEVFLYYHYIQGISLAFKHEHDSDYNKFRAKIINPFDIRIPKNKENEFKKLLDKFNIYRKIHYELKIQYPILNLIWQEPIETKLSKYGFNGWYQFQFLTRYDKNLKIKKPFRKKSTTKKNGTEITLFSEPKFIYSRFQENTTKIPKSIINNHKINLGIKRKPKKFNSRNRS